MTPILYALNVGRGDCFFLEIPNGQAEPFIVLIDGGEEFVHDQAQPAAIAQQLGWDKIDLMILTHLHPDHLVGLLGVADSIHVAEAVLPYPEFSISDVQWEHPKALQTQKLFKQYEQLCESLRSQGTNIHIRPPYGERSTWQLGQAVIRHLDPVQQKDIAGYPLIRQLQDDSLHAEDRQKLLLQFDRISNSDSSIWMIENGLHPHQQWLLMGGDALMPNWIRLLEKETLRPELFKISHHGLKDAFNEDLAKRLAPQFMIITNNEKEAQLYHEWWDHVAEAANAKLLVMGADRKTQYARIELGHPITVMKSEVSTDE